MKLSFDKKVLLAFAALAAGLIISGGIAVAHDHREVGGYQLTVGFRDEPAVEGLANGIELRVEKKAEAAGHGAMSMDASEDDRADGNGGHDGREQMGHEPLVSEVGVDVGITAKADDGGGVKVHVMTNGWRWAPENVNQEHVPGEGHAHVYVDGEKVNRVYGPYYHLNGLEPGGRHVRVTLNANTHNGLIVEGSPVEAATMVTVTGSGRMEGPRPDPVEAPGPISLGLIAHPDPLGGYNLQVVSAGFTFSGNAAGAGEGHAYVSIDGEIHARLYEPWLKLPALEPGMHTISVSLVGSDRRPYSWGGAPAEASITVHVEEEDDGAAHSEKAPSDGAMTEGAGHGHASTVRVEGLEQTLQVEVTHAASGVSRTMPLRAIVGEPGGYTADLIPTAPGVYSVRFFGAIEGNPIDETFESGPGRFSNVEPATDLHFPQVLPTVREIEGAVRGAQSSIEQAQDSAIAAGDDASTARLLGILGIAAGVLGIATGGAGVAVAIASIRK